MKVAVLGRHGTGIGFDMHLMLAGLSDCRSCGPRCYEKNQEDGNERWMYKVFENADFHLPRSTTEYFRGDALGDGELSSQRSNGSLLAAQRHACSL